MEQEKKKMNPQFMKHVAAKEHLLHKVQEVLVPPAQFEKEQPGWAAHFFIAQSINMSVAPLDDLHSVLEYLTGIVLPTSLEQRNYRVFTNTMRLLYACTLTLTSIRCIERIFNDELLLDNMYELGVRPAEKGLMARMFGDPNLLKTGKEATVRLMTLWTDLTMVYQAEFPPLWTMYKRYKTTVAANVKLAKVTGERPVEEHDFDGLRTIMHNFDRQFVDVPIVSVQSDLKEEREWLLSARTDEAFKVYASTFVIKAMCGGAEESKEGEDERTQLQQKLSFLFHYCMNFRAKYVRELKVSFRRKHISSDQYDLALNTIILCLFLCQPRISISIMIAVMTCDLISAKLTQRVESEQLQSISFALKEAKQEIDRQKIKLTAQLQGTQIETHQKWIHFAEEQQYRSAQQQLDQEDPTEATRQADQTAQTQQVCQQAVTVIDLGSLGGGSTAAQPQTVMIDTCK